MLCRLHRGDAAAIAAVWPVADDSSPAQVTQQRTEADGTSVPLEELEQRLAQARKAAETEIRQARESGYASGRQAAAAELEPVLQRLAASIDALAHVRSNLRKQAEADLVKLSLEIARRVLHREVNADPDALQGIVAHLLGQISSRESYEVRCHPSQQQNVQRHLAAAGATRIQIVTDSSLDLGAVIFEAKRGTIDGSIESQLREVERGFIERLSQ